LVHGRVFLKMKFLKTLKIEGQVLIQSLLRRGLVTYIVDILLLHLSRKLNTGELVILERLTIYLYCLPLRLVASEVLGYH